MRPCVTGKVSSSIYYLVVSCGIVSSVLSWHPPTDHFQPFLEALSLKILPQSVDTTATHPTTLPKRAQFRRTGSKSFAFAHISPSHELQLSKVALYNGRRPPTDPVGSLQSNATELKFSLKFLASERFDPYKKEKREAGRYIFNTFKSFGLKAIRQTFKAPYVKHHGVNLIGIRAGSVRLKHESNQAAHSPPTNDHIVVIGAHYDTVENTTGLNDNGSGVGVMLELVRMLDFFQCDTKYTLVFVAFDLEELGAIGSKYFVHEYLIPQLLQTHKPHTNMTFSSNRPRSSRANRNQFKGAIIMDTLLNFSPHPGTQDIPNDIHQTVPDFSETIKRTNYSGDFLAMFGRMNADMEISKLIQQKWANHDSNYEERKPHNETTDWRQYKLRPVHIQTLSRDKEATYEDLQRHVNMLRSDHLHFWYHNHGNYSDTLSAVLLTDTGPFRGYMRYCYHKMCDDSRFLSKQNVNFARKTTEVLMQVLLQLTDGKCRFGGKSN